MDEPLRLRMKLYTDDKGRKFLAAAGMCDSSTGTVYASLMNDQETRNVRFTLDGWNALPFFYFKEDGPAPRMEKKWDMVQGKEVE